MTIQQLKEQEIRKFTNDLGFQLKPSNDTMEAVRLFRKELPDFLLRLEQATREDERSKIKQIIDKYSNAKEIVENGKRYLKVDKRKVEFGYPYPDTREKYIIHDILLTLN